MRSLRSVLLAPVLLSLVAGFLPAPSMPTAATDADRRTGAELDGPHGSFDGDAVLPHTSAGTAGTVDVVAQLSADPAIRARAQGRRAVAEQRRRVGAQQDAVVAAAGEAAGAHPLARLTEALNAVAFRLDRDDVAALAEVESVERVLPVPAYRQRSGDMREQVGAQSVLDDPDGATGEGVRIAVLDTGVDYTHEAFGGPGTEAAYEEAADAKSEGRRPDGLWPDDDNAVVDGVDFLGDEWEQPGDPRAGSDNPLDLEGHGTSVAAMAGGARGVAPGADLLAVQVCSSVTPFCDGLAVLEGLDWAVEQGADVINLSLGAPYLAPEDDPAGLAVAEALDAGVTVVAAGGNVANKPYAVSSPATVPGSIAVAETVLDGAEFEQPLEFDGLRDARGDEVGERLSVHQRWSQMPEETRTVGVHLGEQPGDNAFCDEPLPDVDDGAAVLVFDSPACAISEKSANVRRAGGAIALVGLPMPTEPASSARRECPEGACHELPAYVFEAEDIALLDEQSGAASVDLDDDATVRIAPDRATARERRIAGTSSRGPRPPDGGAKPDIAAPGSAEVAVAGSGDAVAAFGGASGAAPVVAGAAALVIEQARADGGGDDPVTVKARLVGTADPALAGELDARAPLTRLGAGQLRVGHALDADVVAVDVEEPAAGPQVSFGFVDAAGDRSLERDVAVRNLSDETRTVTVALTDVREPSGWSLSADQATEEIEPGSAETVTVRGDITPTALDDWPLDSGRRGGDGPALTDVEATARLEVAVADGRDTAASVHGLARRAAHLRTDASAVDGDLTFTNEGSSVGQVDVFDLIGEADDVLSQLGSFSAEVGDGQALLSLAVTFADRLTHANTRQVVVELSSVDGSPVAELIVLDVGFLLFGFPIGESITVLSQPTAIPGLVNIIDVQVTDHGMHSPTLVLPSQPTLIDGVDAGDLVDVTATAFGSDLQQPLGRIEGRVRLGEARYDAGFLHVEPGTSEPLTVRDRGTPEGTFVSGALTVLDGPLLGLDGFADELPPYVGAPPGEETRALPAPPVRRLSGPDRFTTARAISQDRFADGEADTVVLARGGDFADALAGAPLAAARNGPLLLTPGDRLHPPTATEIDRVLGAAGEVVLLGGTDALSEQVADEVEARGHRLRRVAGATRVETALEIAGRLGDPDELLIADGFAFPDALAAGAAAADRDAAVLLTPAGAPTETLRAYVSEQQAATMWAVGGPAARAFPDARGLAGATRFETAERVARQLFSTPATAGIARGDAFPDALAGGAHAGRIGGPILLSPAGELHPAAARVLCDLAGSVPTAYAYGGTAALTDGTLGAGAERVRGVGC